MEIKIKKYSNGSYSFWSEKRKRHENIPSDLAERVQTLQTDFRIMLDALDGNYVHLPLNQVQALNRIYSKY